MERSQIMPGNPLTLLSPRQRRAFVAIFVLGCLMLVNTIYLVFASHVAGIGRDPEVLPFTYQAVLVSHVVLGVVAFAIVVFFVVSHGGRMWRARAPKNRLTGL